MEIRGYAVALSILMIGSAVEWSGTARAASFTPVLVRVDTGLAAFEGFGYSLANLGDVDVDKIDDYVVGEPFATTIAGDLAGRATVISGRSGNTLYRIDGTIPVPGPGTTTGGLLGWSVGGIRDVDNDRLPDVLVGEPSGVIYAGNNWSDGRSPSRVHVFNGATGHSLHTLVGDVLNHYCMFPGIPPLIIADGFGTNVTSVRDLDGDRIDDIAVGAPLSHVDCTSWVNNWPWANGGHYVFSGHTGQRLYSGSLSVPLAGCDVGGNCAQWDSADHGTAIAPIGDFDRDGYGDFVASAPFASPRIPPGASPTVTGRLTWVSGRTGAAVGTLEAGMSAIGRLMVAAGDANFDGVDEIAVTLKDIYNIGQPGAPEVRVYKGIGSAAGVGTPPIFQAALPSPATSLAIIEDLTGDAVPELVVGMGGYDQDRGRVLIYDYMSSVVIADLSGTQPDQHFGREVEGMGDLTGDGYPELLVSEGSDVQWWTQAPPPPAAHQNMVNVYSLAPPCTDVDGDGYGVLGSYQCAVRGARDCNDGNPAIHPGAAEIPGNGVDENCNGSFVW